MVESDLRMLEEMVTLLEQQQNPQLYPKTVEQYKKCVQGFEKIKTQKVKAKQIKSSNFDKMYQKCLDSETDLSEAVKLKVSLLKFIGKEMKRLEECKLTIH